MAGKTTTKTLTYGEVWKALTKVDCNEHVKKKGNLSYLSWAWAWGVLMDNYPQAEYTFTQSHTLMDDGSKRHLDTQFYPDGTASVTCTIEIGKLSREMWLPVMDFRNNSLPNPTSRQISDAKMRCLVKCMAMFGLGYYIYAGEDLPTDGATTEDDLAKAGMPVDKAPTSGVTKEHAEKVMKARETKPKKPTKAQQERTRMVNEIKENVTHPALNDISRTAIEGFLAKLHDMTPKSEVEMWYDRMLTVIAEHNAREKERVFLKEQEASKVDNGAPVDLFAESVTEVTKETVGA